MKKRWSSLLVLLVLGGGGTAYYFFFMKEDPTPPERLKSQLLKRLSKSRSWFKAHYGAKTEPEQTEFYVSDRKLKVVELLEVDGLVTDYLYKGEK